MKMILNLSSSSKRTLMKMKLDQLNLLSRDSYSKSSQTILLLPNLSLTKSSVTLMAGSSMKMERKLNSELLLDLLNCTESSGDFYF